MSAIDGWLEGLLHGEVGVGIILLVSLLLGLRHASDPDHLAAVTTLIASGEERHQVRKAGTMGFLWGLGHGTTLVLIGLPLVLLNQYLPEIVGKIAEVAIGGIIVLLAMRLLVTDSVTVALETLNCVAMTGVANEIVTMSKNAKK